MYQALTILAFFGAIVFGMIAIIGDYTVGYVFCFLFGMAALMGMLRVIANEIVQAIENNKF